MQSILLLSLTSKYMLRTIQKAKHTRQLDFVALHLNLDHIVPTFTFKYAQALSSNPFHFSLLLLDRI
jgi:hypothetical protein